MNLDTPNDRTDHNRLAEQFAARLREAAEPTAPVADQAPQPARKPRRTPRIVEAAAPVIIIADAAAAPEIATEVSPEILRAQLILPEMKIFTCEQNTPEWHMARLGIPTASNFQTILTPGKTKTEQKTRRTYMLKLAGEILTGVPMDMAETYDMKRGHIVEPEARDLYALKTGAVLERVGFIRRGRAGCSPDSLIGADGGLEIKTKAPHLMLDLLEKDEFPEEHKAQVQGALWLSDREWWDLDVVAVVEIDGRPTLAPNIPSFTKRAYRDEAYIANLAAEVERFNTDLDAIVAQMRGRMEAEQSFELAAA